MCTIDITLQMPPFLIYFGVSITLLLTVLGGMHITCVTCFNGIIDQCDMKRYFYSAALFAPMGKIIACTYIYDNGIVYRLDHCADRTMSSSD